MTNETKDFFNMLMKQLDTIPVEKLKEAYEPTSYNRALNYMDKNQTTVINLAETVLCDTLLRTVPLTNGFSCKNNVEYPSSLSIIDSEDINFIAVA